ILSPESIAVTGIWADSGASVEKRTRIFAQQAPRETLENPSNPRDHVPVIAGLVRVHGREKLGFGDYEQTTAMKRTKRERFLGQMEALCPGGPANSSTPTERDLTSGFSACITSSGAYVLEV
ncbi:MAG: hypothetical protein ACK55R_06205, partial [Cyanobacteriota bacterium]